MALKSKRVSSQVKYLRKLSSHDVEHVEGVTVIRVKSEQKSRTLSTISELHMGRLLRGAKGIEHLGPATPDPEGKKETKTQTKKRTDGCMGANLVGSRV